MLGNNKIKTPDFTATNQPNKQAKQTPPPPPKKKTQSVSVEGFLMFASQFSLNKANTDTNIQTK